MARINKMKNKMKNQKSRAFLALLSISLLLVLTISLSAQEGGLYKTSYIEPVERPIPYFGDAVYFDGRGFALNEDKSKGLLVDLKLLEKGNGISGKISIGNADFKVKGNIFSEVVKFDLFNIFSKEKVVTFSGKVEKFGNFDLLKGELNNFEGETWILILISKQKFSKIVVSPYEKTRKMIGMSEIIYLDKRSETEENGLYINPIEIRKPKFLGFIPNPFGKRTIVLEMIDGGNVFRKTIKEHQREKIGNYFFGIDSLEDEENIEFSVEKA